MTLAQSVYLQEKPGALTAVTPCVHQSLHRGAEANIIYNAPTAMLQRTLVSVLFISVDRLERLVIDELNRLSAEYLDKDELEQNIEFCGNLQGQKDRLSADLATYRKKALEYSKGIRDLYMDKVKGLISESDFIDMSKGFSTERDRLERVIADGEKQLAELDEKIAAGDNRRELIEKYTNLEHLTREIVETLIDYISVGKRIPGTRDVPIEIHWNF